MFIQSLNLPDTTLAHRIHNTLVRMSALKTLVGANYTVTAIIENPNVAKVLYNVLWVMQRHPKLFGNWKARDAFIAQKIEEVVSHEFPYLFNSIGGATLKRNIQKFVDNQYTTTGFEDAYLDHWKQYLDEDKVNQWIGTAQQYTKDAIIQNARIATGIYDVVQYAAVYGQQHAPHVQSFIFKKIENHLPAFSLRQFTTGVNDFVHSISNDIVFLDKYLEYWQDLQDPHGWNPTRMAHMQNMLLSPYGMINSAS